MPSRPSVSRRPHRASRAQIHRSWGRPDPHPGELRRGRHRGRRSACPPRDLERPGLTSRHPSGRRGQPTPGMPREFVFRWNRRRTPMASVQTLLGLGSPREWEPTTCAEIHRPGGGGRPARDRRPGLTRVSRPDGPEGRRAPGPLPPTPHARGGGSRRRGPEPPAGPSADAPGSGAGRGPCVAPGARRSLAACA